MQEKEQGNAAYKKKDFETALQHYGKAIELDPKNMAFYTNRAGWLTGEGGKWDKVGGGGRWDEVGGGGQVG